VGDELDHGLHADGRGIVSALEQVDTGYEHIAKVARPQSSLTLRSTVLMVRDRAETRRPPRHPRARPPEPARRVEAAATCGSAATSASDPPSLRRGLLLPPRLTWQNENELWETVWAKGSSESFFFRPDRRGRTARRSAWAIGAVCHERQAWSDYLRSARDATAKGVPRVDLRRRGLTRSRPDRSAARRAEPSRPADLPCPRDAESGERAGGS
jgi:hypothetical protein